MRRVRLPWTRDREPRILGLLPFHNEMRFLPGFFENVPPQVDGLIGLDDRSTDGSDEYVSAQSSVIELLHTSADGTGSWRDRENHRLLTQAAWRHGADWLLGIDADERLEDGFRRRALGYITAAQHSGASAYRLHFRELWDEPDAYRVDGVWGRKGKAAFFQARPDHVFDQRELHGHWAPLNDYPTEDFPQADLVIYHLRMLKPEDREARRLRYKTLDPDCRWQAVGYDYMTDVRGLLLEKLPAGRGYTPLGR